MEFNPYVLRSEYRVNAIDQEMGQKRQEQKAFSKKEKSKREIEIFKKQLWDLAKVIPKASKRKKAFTPLEDLKKEVEILEHQVLVLDALHQKNPIREDGNKKKFVLDFLKGILFKNKKLTYHKVKKKSRSCQKELGLNLNILKKNLLDIKMSNVHETDFVDKKRILLRRVEKLIALNYTLF